MPSRKSKQTPSPDLQFDAIGTHWQIDTAESLAPSTTSAVCARIDQFNRTWSRFRTDSLVHRISAGSGIFAFPPEAGELFSLYRALYECTDGAMSPLVGRALEEWGYDSAYSLKPASTISAIPRWEDAVSWDGNALHSVRPVVLDVGAAGKGYLVDLVAELLLAHGVAAFTMDAGGDLLHHGLRPLRVALEHPLDASKAIGVAELESGALCASASNRRAWPGAHHLIDATTGMPSMQVLATWVTARTCLVADGLATALFLAEPARLSERFDFEFVRMFRGGRIEISPGFEAEMFL